MATTDYQPPFSQMQQEIESLRASVEFYRTTLRDQFATAALQGIISQKLSRVAECAEKRGISCADYYAIAAYEYADAMMKAREAKGDDL